MIIGIAFKTSTTLRRVVGLCLSNAMNGHRSSLFFEIPVLKLLLPAFVFWEQGPRVLFARNWWYGSVASVALAARIVRRNSYGGREEWMYGWMDGCMDVTAVQATPFEGCKPCFQELGIHTMDLYGSTSCV
jgi:hypothetical protein